MRDPEGRERSEDGKFKEERQPAPAARTRRVTLFLYIEDEQGEYVGFMGHESFQEVDAPTIDLWIRKREWEALGRPSGVKVVVERA